MMALTDDMIALTGADESKANIYLGMAESIIINRLYSNMDEEKTYEMPSRYENLKLRMAVYLFNKEGAEGETSHSEGGVSRSYSDGDIPKSMLDEIVPMAVIL